MDSMSGEHVGTTSGLIVTSGKSGIRPLVAPENQGICVEGKDLGKNNLGYIAYVRRRDTV
jgi:hypothetical protein